MDWNFAMDVESYFASNTLAMGTCSSCLGDLIGAIVGENRKDFHSRNQQMQIQTIKLKDAIATHGKKQLIREITSNFHWVYYSSHISCVKLLL